jgi:hypothetical protein
MPKSIVGHSVKQLRSMNYLRAGSTLNELKNQEHQFALCSALVKHNKNLGVWDKVRSTLAQLARTDVRAIRLLEQMAEKNKKDGHIKAETLNTLSHLAEEGRPVSLPRIRKIALSDPIDNARSWGLTILVQMARQGEQKTLQTFVRAIRNEKILQTWRSAETGLRELARQGNLKARMEVMRIDNGTYERPTRVHNAISRKQ